MTTCANSIANAIELLVEEKVRAIAPTATRWMRRGDSPLPLKTLRRAVREGKIAASRIDKSKVILLDRAQHDAFIAEHSIGRAAAVTDDDDELAAAFGVARRTR